MKYKPHEYYKSEYLKTVAILMPLVVLIFKMNNIKHHINIAAFIGIPIIFATEYEYALPRQAIKVYETILFRTFSKNVDRLIKVLLLGGIIGAAIYYIYTGNLIPMLIDCFIYLILEYGLKGQSLVIGDKSLIIGRRMFSHSSINSISVESKNTIINTDEGTFEISNWLIKKRKLQLENVVKKVIINR